MLDNTIEWLLHPAQLPSVAGHERTDIVLLRHVRKTVMTTTVIDYLYSRFGNIQVTGIACHSRRRSDEKIPES